MTRDMDPQEGEVYGKYVRLAGRDRALQLATLLQERDGARSSPVVLWHLLSDAVVSNQVDCAGVLLDAGADPELIRPYWGSTVLTTAAGFGHLDCVEFLLDRGVLVDGLPAASYTALMDAAIGGHFDVVRVLHEHGADLDRDSLGGVGTALTMAEDPPPNIVGNEKIVDYLVAAGATKPWDYKRPSGFWSADPAYATLLLVESCLGLVSSAPVAERKSRHYRFDVRRARHGWHNAFHTVFSAGLTRQGGNCEVGVCLTSKWPLHRRALEEERFRRPVDFVAGLSERILAGLALRHGDVLDREDPALRELPWPSDARQWLVVAHESFEARRRELNDDALPTVLLVIPHLQKSLLKPGKDARSKADAKAKAAWEKPALGGGRNNLVVPLCYEAPWLEGRWY